MSDNNNANEAISLSKQRKIQRKKDIERSKRNKTIGRIVWLVILALLAVAACFAVFTIVRNIATHVTMSSEYSKFLASDGHIEGVKATDYAVLPEYKGLSVRYTDIEYTDEDIEKAIASLTESKAAQSEDTDKAVEKDDEIVVEYTSYFEDGTAVEKGVTSGSGSTITVGGSSLKDYGFDDALVGKKISDGEFDVEVTFPETYTADTTVAGKTIKYTVKINSIKIVPEFTDEFVKEYYSDYASTADEYKAKLRTDNERTKLVSKVTEMFTENAAVKSYPKTYLNHLKSLLKYNEYENYNYYNALYQAYFGTVYATSFDAYLEMSEAKYDRTTLVENAKEQLAVLLCYQAVAETEGITATLDGYKEYAAGQGSTEDQIASMVETYGENYLIQRYLITKINDFIADSANITKITQ